MAMQTNIEAQISILEKRLETTPEKIGNKYNPAYFALKGLINKKKRALIFKKKFEWLAQ